MVSKRRFSGSRMVNSALSSFGPEPRSTTLRYSSKLPATEVLQRYPKSTDPLIQDSPVGTGEATGDATGAAAGASGFGASGFFSAGSWPSSGIAKARLSRILIAIGSGP